MVFDIFSLPFLILPIKPCDVKIWSNLASYTTGRATGFDFNLSLINITWECWMLIIISFKINFYQEYTRANRCRLPLATSGRKSRVIVMLAIAILYCTTPRVCMQKFKNVQPFWISLQITKQRLFLYTLYLGSIVLIG